MSNLNRDNREIIIDLPRISFNQVNVNFPIIILIK